VYQTTLSPAPAGRTAGVNNAIKTGDHIPALGAPGSALIVTVTKVRVALSHPVASFWAAAYAV
jgi:hypothetical protein